MGFVIIWIICGGIAAMIASSKGGSGAIGFLVGVLLGPFGIIAAFFMGDEKKLQERQITTGDSKKCPRCAELVKPDALVCKHCGNEFASA
jgi:hypothetical protein